MISLKQKKSFRSRFITQSVILPNEDYNKVEKVKVNHSTVAADFMRKVYGEQLVIAEHFYVLLLNRANYIQKVAHISSGGVNSTLVDIKILAAHIAGNLSPAIILVHNHPSGALYPSGADKELTKKIQKMCTYLDCQVLDHIILTEEDYYSFADSNIL